MVEMNARMEEDYRKLRGIPLPTDHLEPQPCLLCEALRTQLAEAQTEIARLRYEMSEPTELDEE